MLVGCSSSGSPSAAPRSNASTWASATCRDWLDGMSSDERVAAAEQFVGAMHGYDRSRSFARTFARSITTDCEPAPQSKVDEVAAALATLDTNDFP